MPQHDVAMVEGVSKKFIVNKERSLKESTLAFVRRKARHQDFWALRDIDLEVKAGLTLGLVGHNGSGKSTLLKIIGGILEPTDGRVMRRGRLAALLELGAGFHPDLTGRENVYLNAAILGLTKRETRRHFDEMVEFSGIERFIDTQVKFYSSGMYVRLGFSVAVHVDPDLLLVDEVLAVGDEPFQRKCIDKIASFQKEGRTIVFVSHSADHVGRLCDEVAVLDEGRIVKHGSAESGLAALRAQYEERARRGLQTVRAAEGEKASGPAPFVVERVTAHVTALGGELDLSIVVTTRVLEPDPTWGVSVSIDSSSGTRVYAINTYSMDVALPTSAGQHQVTFDFTSIPLGGGSYLVNAAVGNRSRSFFQQVRAAALFDIPFVGEAQGLLRLDPRVTVDMPAPSN